MKKTSKTKQSPKSKIEITPDYYISDGKKYSRVSSFTGGVFYAKQKPAMERGSLCHKYFDMVNTGKLNSNALTGLRLSNSFIYDAVINYSQWCKENKIKIIFSEQTFLNDYCMAGGTIDLFCDINMGKSFLIDIKTGCYYKSYLLQLGTYRQFMIDAGHKPERFGFLYVNDKVVKFQEIDEKDLILGHTAWLNYLGYKRTLDSIKNY